MHALVRRGCKPRELVSVIRDDLEIIAKVEIKNKSRIYLALTSDGYFLKSDFMGPPTQSSAVICKGA